MEIFLSGDFDSVTKLDVPQYKFDDELIKFFSEKDYSDKLKELALFFISRPKELNLRMRKRYDKNKFIFYLDLYVDYDLMVTGTSLEREIYFLESLKQTIPALMKLKSRLKDLKVDEFEKDLNSFLSQYL